VSSWLLVPVLGSCRAWSLDRGAAEELSPGAAGRGSGARRPYLAGPTRRGNDSLAKAVDSPRSCRSVCSSSRVVPRVAGGALSTVRARGATRAALTRTDRSG